MSVVDRLPACWSVIATRKRRCAKDEKLTWLDAPGAMITAEWAWRLLERGEIFMASRHERDQVQLLVKPNLEQRARMREIRKFGFVSAENLSVAVSVASLNGRSGGRKKQGSDEADAAADEHAEAAEAA